MNITEFLKDNIVILDGGMGTLLQGAGLKAGEYPERWNITHPQTIQAIHKAYFDAGSNIVCTNTFGANVLKFAPDELEEIIKSAIANAKAAARDCTKSGERFVALDVGPCGKLLKPYGDYDFEEAVECFATTVRLGAKHGVDLVMIETMSDSYETKAALLAAKENCELPVFVSNAYGTDGKLMTGADPEAMVAMLEGLGADAVGVNCSLGPKALTPVVQRYIECASVPVLIKPNAGLPREENGTTVYDVGAREFGQDVAQMIRHGARIAGGCCGTTAEYISALCHELKGTKPCPIEPKHKTVVSSYTHSVEFGKVPVLIGERINPTGKKRFKQALIENDMDYVLNAGISQQEKGVHILDVNVGLPEIDEPKMLEDAVCRLQAVVDLPLQIDTSDPVAMERALRRYNGKPLINSVNGKEESLKAILPLVKKYGGVVVALTLDENGIPSTAAERVEIARKIINTAKEYGIDKKDIIFDTLAMTISAAPDAAVVTLEALEMIRRDLGCHTSLGVSNISFGLPSRDGINSTFFALALGKGLSAAIMNPNSADMMRTYYAFGAIGGMDENCSRYIDFASKWVSTNVEKSPSTPTASDTEQAGLKYAVQKGMGDAAAKETQKLLQTVPPLDIVQNEIIPALNAVGKAYEDKTAFLPQLLMSAEAAGEAFEVIKAHMTASGEGDKTQKAKCQFVIATVKGDIHDIGKNIVKLLLENYGFDVTDMGKDVDPQVIVDAVVDKHAPIVGLSALMTTTVPSMADTIALLRQKAPWCKIVVGGAVLTEDYARKIGADKYAADAMETVRYAEMINEDLK